MEETGQSSASTYPTPADPIESASNPAHPTINPNDVTGDPAYPPAYPQQPAGDPTYPPAYPQQPAGYPAYPSAYPQQPAGYPANPSAYPQQPAGYPANPSAYPQQPIDKSSYPHQPMGAQQPFTTVTVVNQPNHNANSGPPMPPTYLPFTVFNIMCCCFLLGLLAKRSGAQVIFEYERRNYEEAKKASRKALSFNIAALLAGIAIWIIVIGFIVGYVIVQF